MRTYFHFWKKLHGGVWKIKSSVPCNVLSEVPFDETFLKLLDLPFRICHGKNNGILFIPLFVFAVCILSSCCSLRNYDYDYIECNDLPREAVDIAVADYHKSRSARKDFSGMSAVKVYVSYTSTDWFYVAMTPWTDGTDKIPIASLDKYMGHMPPDYIPTEYMEKDNVLYVWHNPQMVLTEDVRRVLAKYHLLLYPGDEWILTTDGGDMSYIFCKADYKRKYYRKVKAPFRTPLPFCDCYKQMSAHK